MTFQEEPTFGQELELLMEKHNFSEEIKDDIRIACERGLPPDETEILRKLFIKYMGLDPCEQHISPNSEPTFCGIKT